MARFRLVKTPLLGAVALLALVACVGKEDARPPVRTPPVLARVPIPDVARLLDTVSTGEAARVVLSLPWPAESVAAFYRRHLPPLGFRIVSESGDSLERQLLALRTGPPLWIQIEAGPGPGASRLTLIGAVGGDTTGNDTTVRDSARAGSLR
jgi:hypothetical protein